MVDYLNNQEIENPGESRENKDVEQVLSPEQGVTLGGVVAGHLQQIRDDKKKLKQEVEDGASELLRLNHRAAAGALKSESDEILTEAEKAGQEYVETLKKEMPDIDKELNQQVNQTESPDV